MEIYLMVDMSFSIYTEKIPNKGEDAEPLLDQQEECGDLGVFDGLGGAGCMQYVKDNAFHTGAYYSSKQVKRCVESFIVQHRPALNKLSKQEPNFCEMKGVPLCGRRVALTDRLKRYYYRSKGFY